MHKLETLFCMFYLFDNCQIVLLVVKIIRKNIETAQTNQPLYQNIACFCLHRDIVDLRLSIRPFGLYLLFLIFF